MTPLHDNDFRERMEALSAEQRVEVASEIAEIVADIQLDDDHDCCIWLGDGCFEIGPADDDRFFPVDLYLDARQVWHLGNGSKDRDALMRSIRDEIRTFAEVDA
jgi:hypothetical protein